MKRAGSISMIVWLLLGATIGAVVAWRVMERRQPEAKVEYAMVRYLDKEPHHWLLKPGSTIRDIYHSPEATHILEAPERVTLHTRAGDKDPQAVDHVGYRFNATGVEITAEILEFVLYSVRSVSSYRNMSACSFDPLVMLRVTRGGKDLDILFCFSCNDSRSYCEGKAMGGGISDEGKRAFVRYFHQVLPDELGLKRIFDSYPRTQGE